MMACNIQVSVAVSSESPTASLAPTSPAIGPSNTVLITAPDSKSVPPFYNEMADIPPDFLACGWRKFWSKREKRFYFFNKFSGENAWELPPPMYRQSQMADPLGIAIASTTGASKRHNLRVSDSISAFLGPSPNKRSWIQPVIPEGVSAVVTVAGPWDLEVATNVIIYERQPCSRFPHPHPEIELRRCGFILKLRQSYQEMCHSREGINAPKGSLNKWLLERRLVDQGSDPVLPSLCSSEISVSMFHDIMADIPVILVKPKFTGEARKQISRYCESAKKLIEARSCSSESRKIVLWNVEDTFNWLRRTVGASYEDLQKRLSFLQTQCQPHIREASRSNVEGICRKMYKKSKEFAQKLKEQQIAIQDESDKNVLPPVATVPHERRVWCYPVHMAATCPSLPCVSYCIEKNQTYIKYQNESILVNTQHFLKLEHLYRYGCADDRKYEHFLCRTWILLKRYSGYVGIPATVNDASCGQTSLPPAVFECLANCFGVTFECFASPLNCYFRQYCSAFPDIDSFFGSRGPFMEFVPLCGSFEVNPPLSEQLLEATVDHMEKLLKDSATIFGHHDLPNLSTQTPLLPPQPLSFIVFLPQWDLDPPPSIQKLESSKWKRKQITVEPNDHEFISGFQHVLPKSDISVRPLTATVIIWLQNDAAFHRWSPSEEKVNLLLESFRKGSQRERDKITAISDVQSTEALTSGSNPDGVASNGVSNNLLTSGSSLDSTERNQSRV